SLGDTIAVAAGTYLENVSITKKVRLIGQGAGATIIDGKNLGHGVSIVADSVTIKGFTIQNAGNNRYGIFLNSSRFCTIDGNSLKNNQRSNLVVSGSTKSHYNHTITTTNISYNKPIYYFFDRFDETIENLSAGNITLAWCTRMQVRNCLIDTGDYLLLDNTTSSTVTGCTLKYCRNLDNGIVELLNSSNNTIQGCSVISPVGHGIQMVNSNGNTIENCTVEAVTANRSSISLVNSTACTLTGNNMKNFSSNGFSVSGTSKEHFNHTIGSTNLVNNRGLYYYFDLQNTTLSSLDAGHITVAYCKGVTLTACSVTGGDYLRLYNSSHNLIQGGVFSACMNEFGAIQGEKSDSNTISNCQVSQNRGNGITISNSTGNSINGCTAAENRIAGINIVNATGCTLENNRMDDNWNGNLVVRGVLKNNYNHLIATSNTVKNRSVYYLFDKQNQTFSLSDAGHITVAWSNNVTLTDCDIQGDPLQLLYTNNSLVENSTISNTSPRGFYGRNSNNNTIKKCVIALNPYDGLLLSACTTTTCYQNVFQSNGCGVNLINSASSLIYHNNFLNNNSQAADNNSTKNVWYNPQLLEGNYWSNYQGLDNGTGDGKHAIADDGIGDTRIPHPYANFDSYPFMSLIVFEPKNIPPVAQVGSDISSHPGKTVMLDGSASFDSDNDYPLSFSWTIVEKPPESAASIDAPTLINPSITIDALGNYVIELVVTDARSAVSLASRLTISTQNTAPVADAGADISVTQIGQIIHLDGTQSWDVEGDETAYQWSIVRKPDNSTVSLDNPTAATPSFVPDVYGSYTFSLVVSDPWMIGQPDEVVVSFENLLPQANAGSSATVVVGGSITLDGSASTDPNGDNLTYHWSITAAPAGSTVLLSDYTAAAPQFTTNMAGEYILCLVVSDGLISSAPDQVTIVAVTINSQVIEALKAAITASDALGPLQWKNKNMAATFTNKITVVIKNIDEGDYQEAYIKLLDDVIEKTNGCTFHGEPDKNDWIIQCSGQSSVYPYLQQALSLLGSL
ncbi:MAG: right-handed parallel beta-helix repeat-containing protein, partial [Chitinivibrionales bacterium]|nr:right-handed parallel beta-helix repeat-containing protein [Chitinivibrionales bacterium]